MNTPNSSEPIKSPDEIVEGRILKRLKETFPDNDVMLEELQGKLSSGLMKADDWRVKFEITQDKEQKLTGDKS